MTDPAYTIQPLTRSEARQILDWRYEAPYDFYNPPVVSDPENLVNQFVEPERAFHGVRDRQHRFVGFCSFGEDGQVLGGRYEDGPLDIGLGMKPAVTSRGQGRGFVTAIVQFAQQHYQAETIRLSVAEFNERAIRVYRNLGFKPTQQFCDLPDLVPYWIMELELT